MDLALPVETEIPGNDPEPGRKGRGSIGLEAKQASETVFSQLLANKYEAVGGVFLVLRRDSRYLIQGVAKSKQKISPGPLRMQGAETAQEGGGFGVKTTG